MLPKDPRVQQELDSLNRLLPDKSPVKTKENGSSSCKHDKGFNITWGNVWENKTKIASYPAIWKCNLNCGFFLNFDPDIFPEGVGYLPRPKKEKKLPKSRPSKY